MKIKKKLMLLFLITLAVLFIIIYVFPNVTGALKKTEIIQYGSLQVTDDVTAYIVRNEEVYFANKAGSINYYAQQAEQVRRGAKILEITYKNGDAEESKYENLNDTMLKYCGGESLLVDDKEKIKLHIKKLLEQKETKLSEGDLEESVKIENQIKRLNQKIDYINADGNENREKIIKANLAENAIGKTPDNYICKTNGIISYYVDGYENEFNPLTMQLLSRDKVKKIDIEVNNLTRKSTQKMEPLYKLVDNSKWYVLFWVEPENIVKYQKDKTAYLNFPESQVEGKIYDIIDDDGQYLVIIEVNRYYEQFSKIRKTEMKIITSDYKGLTIKNEDITTKDGQTGVYVKNKSGEYEFKPIKIITSDGEFSLVEVSYFYTDNGAKKIETVNIYDEILKNPS